MQNKNNILNASLGTEIKVNNVNYRYSLYSEVKREIEKIEVDNYGSTSN